MATAPIVLGINGENISITGIPEIPIASLNWPPILAAIGADNTSANFFKVFNQTINRADCHKDGTPIGTLDGLGLFNEYEPGGVIPVRDMDTLRSFIHVVIKKCLENTTLKSVKYTRQKKQAAQERNIDGVYLILLDAGFKPESYLLANQYVVSSNLGKYFDPSTIRDATTTFARGSRRINLTTPFFNAIGYPGASEVTGWSNATAGDKDRFNYEATINTLMGGETISFTGQGDRSSDPNIKRIFDGNASKDGILKSSNIGAGFKSAVIYAKSWGDKLQVIMAFILTYFKLNGIDLIDLTNFVDGITQEHLPAISTNDHVVFLLCILLNVPCFLIENEKVKKTGDEDKSKKTTNIFLFNPQGAVPIKKRISDAFEMLSEKVVVVLKSYADARGDLTFLISQTGLQLDTVFINNIIADLTFIISRISTIFRTNLNSLLLNATVLLDKIQPFLYACRQKIATIPDGAVETDIFPNTTTGLTYTQVYDGIKKEIEHLNAALCSSFYKIKLDGQQYQFSFSDTVCKYNATTTNNPYVETRNQRETTQHGELIAPTKVTDPFGPVYRRRRNLTSIINLTSAPPIRTGGNKKKGNKYITGGGKEEANKWALRVEPENTEKSDIVFSILTDLTTTTAFDLPFYDYSPTSNKRIKDTDETLYSSYTPKDLTKAGFNTDPAFVYEDDESNYSGYTVTEFITKLNINLPKDIEDAEISRITDDEPDSEPVLLDSDGKPIYNQVPSFDANLELFREIYYIYNLQNKLLQVFQGIIPFESDFSYVLENIMISFDCENGMNYASPLLWSKMWGIRLEALLSYISCNLDAASQPAAITTLQGLIPLIDNANKYPALFNALPVYSTDYAVEFKKRIKDDIDKAIEDFKQEYQEQQQPMPTQTSSLLKRFSFLQPNAVKPTYQAPTASPFVDNKQGTLKRKFSEQEDSNAVSAESKRMALSRSKPLVFLPDVPNMIPVQTFTGSIAARGGGGGKKSRKNKKNNHKPTRKNKRSTLKHKVKKHKKTRKHK